MTFSTIILPLIMSNIMHMWVISKDIFRRIAIPLSSSLFGINKTYRGFIVLPILNTLFSLLLYILVPCQSLQYMIFTGFILGITYMLFELPNSYLKRKFGIPAGESSEKNRVLFSIMDKSDSCIGVSIVCYFIFRMTLADAFILFITSVSLHFTLSYILVLTNLKKSL